MKFSQFISEAFNINATVKKIAKELQSDDWGYSINGGNGRVLVQKGLLVVRDGFYYEGPRTLELLMKRFVGGESRSEGDYFSKKYKVNFKLVKKEIQHNKKLWPSSNTGVAEIVLSVEPQE